MRRILSVVICCFTLFLAATLHAQAPATTSVSVPNLIRYSSMLKNPQGMPLVSSTVGVTFAIYKQPDGGAPVWLETQNVTTDANGNYSVLLGSTAAIGLPSDLFSQQEQRWLGVQVEGETEQARVLMVSVPYAFKAHEADTLGGKSVSDFVLVTPANSASISGAGSLAITASNSSSSSAANSGANYASSSGPTNFSGTTTDQIVGVTQSGTGVAINATAASKAVVGTATDPSATAYGVQGVATGTAGVGLIGTATSTTGFTYGLRGTSSSTSGTGVRGIDNATSGSTTGVSGYVNSVAGTAGVFNNAAGGNILVGQNNGATEFTVDGNGNVTGSGNLTGSQLISTVANGTAPLQVTSTTVAPNLNASLLQGHPASDFALANSVVSSFNGRTGTVVPTSGDYNFSLLSGTLGSSQLSGAYSNAVTLSNTGSTYYGDGSHLTGVVGGTGTANYLPIWATANSVMSSVIYQDSSGKVGVGTTTPQVNLDVNGKINSATTYGIGESTVLSIGTSADNNLFLGVGAGASNEAGSGKNNMFSGFESGFSNTTGTGNTFVGFNAGYNNTTGSNNTFIGRAAGSGNTGGAQNTFTGSEAGQNNTGTFAIRNVFDGYQAGYNNIGGYNVFSGYQAGYNNTGDGNVFSGDRAGYSNTGGVVNTAIGDQAGYSLIAGYGNIFIGQLAGFNNTNGSFNVYVGNSGCNSPCTESGAIRIGDPSSQSATWIAGISGSTSSGGIPVLVNGNGRLGTMSSSVRFKEQVRDMSDSTSALMKLRPVTFLYKPEYADGERTLQYGLIAEEVAKVYPELVAYDNDGQPYAVRYQYLSTMLLNEMQKQYRRTEAQTEIIEAQAKKIEQLEERLSRLEELLVNQSQLLAQK